MDIKGCRRAHHPVRPTLWIIIAIAGARLREIYGLTVYDDDLHIFFFRRKYAPDDALSDKFFENARVSRCIRLYKVLCYFCFVSFLRVAVFDFFLGIHGECWL